MKIHQSLLELMQIQPESTCYRECNWDFTGGCLATVPQALSSGSILLAHPCGDKLNKLAVSEYKPVPSNSKEAFLQKQSTLVLDTPDGADSTVFQVSLQNVQEETSCCVRLRNHCQYIRLFDSLNKDPTVLSEFAYDESLCCTTPSKHIFGELLAITKAGNMLLQQCDRTEPSWRASVSHERPSSNQWWCASFGSHPRHICYMDRSGLYSLDARRPGSRKHTFCTIHHEAFLKDEFMLFKPNPLNCHQLYLASSKLLSVWDERHTRQPMLTWNHCLQHSPAFLELTPFKDFEDGSHHDLYVTLGSQRSRQTAVFHVRQDSSSVQPISLVPPWHLSRPSDFVKHLEHQGCSVDEHVLRRVKAPLIGGCMIECGNGAFSALQLTSYGDIFHQARVTSDDDSPLRQRNREELANLQDMIIRAMNETRCPEGTGEMNEDAHASIVDFSQGWIEEQQQQEQQKPLQQLEHQEDIWQDILHGEDAVSTLTSRAVNPPTNLTLLNSEPEYYDPSQPLFDENDLSSLTQVSVTQEREKFRQPRLPLKKKKISMDGF
ncbi:hypothetical protein HPB50_009411 [Hyalomma asiaticum]|uniref:Uncharacterized protein n=1 Tax=Hyalomma asiaticum TaxID=266040 RepID=A0ACB7SXB5_HYAAI|nr:hypothetical protein HPB50_009411 [Hyalomma asiaticum]